MPRVGRLTALTCALYIAATTAAPGATDGHAFAAPDRVVAFGDVHGAYADLVALLQAADIVDATLAWRGGRAHLVSVGDLLDRGPDSRRVLDLLMRLESEAIAAGGRVHVVLGNHELMNLTGELDYVSAAEFASYRDLETEAMRAAAFASLRAAGRFGEADLEEARASFDARFPPGYFGHRRAFAPDGRYGRWLLGLPVLVRIGEVAFVHGGLPPMLAGTDLAAVNESLRTDIATYAHTLERLVRAGLVDPDTPFAERASLARQRLERLPAGERTGLAEAVEVLDRSATSPVHDPRGPLWYRGTALCHALYETDIALAALQALEAREVAIGHTPTPTARVTARLDGRAFLIDTGMLKPVYRGRAAALVIERGSRRVIYADGASESPAPPRPESRRVGARPGGMDDDALEAFLKDAQIVRAEPLAEATLLTLRQGEVTLRAVFHAGQASGWRRELAAYRVDRLIGLGMIPVAAPREHGGERGALQFRVEGDETVAALEQRDARFGGWCPLEPQYALVAAFDALIGNRHRSKANVWFSPEEGMVRLTGHDAAFSSSRTIGPAAGSVAMPRELARRLETLTRESLRAELGAWLGARDIDAMLARRDELLRLVRGRAP